MIAYYNELDPGAAAWLRELISSSLIAPGVVDDRSIVDVRPADLAGFDQCHFFAGIGVWSHALRCAGWPDDRPVWTGSCPCQPFSAAGQRKGHADERHLWPVFHDLIAECRPATVIGERVASKDGREWFAAVRADLEHMGYAVGGADLPAAGVGAPHIRQRLYWMADADHAGLEGRREPERERAAERPAGAGGVAGGLGHPERLDAGRDSGTSAGAEGGTALRSERHDAGSSGSVGGLADAAGPGRRSERQDGDAADSAETVLGGAAQSRRRGATDRPRPTDGFWRAADWLGCRDGKWRPVSPSTFPLAHGAPARVGRLRGYGNAIVAPLAQAFIEAVMAI